MSRPPPRALTFSGRAPWRASGCWTGESGLAREAALRSTEQQPAPFWPSRSSPRRAVGVVWFSHITTAHHLRRPRRGRQTSPGQGRVRLLQDNRWPRLRLVHALVRQRIRQELALQAGSGPGRARSPVRGGAGGPGGPDRRLSRARHWARPSGREPVRPARPRLAPTSLPEHPDDGRWIRARRIRHRRPSWSRAGRPLGVLCRPDTATDPENGQGARRPAWLGSGATGQALDVVTGLC